MNSSNSKNSSVNLNTKVSQENLSKSNRSRPPSVIVPFNRELSYYSTNDSQCCLNFTLNIKELQENKENEPQSFHMLSKTHRTDRISLALEKEETESDGEIEDLNCSFNSLSSSGEENKNSLSNKMKFLKSMKLKVSNLESFDENMNESNGTSSGSGSGKLSYEDILSQRETSSE